MLFAQHMHALIEHCLLTVQAGPQKPEVVHAFLHVASGLEELTFTATHQTTKSERATRALADASLVVDITTDEKSSKICRTIEYILTFLIIRMCDRSTILII